MSEIRILLVDDEEFYLRLFGDILATRRYQVATARNGTQALSVLKDQRFDILITDLVMDQVDGLVLAEIVKDQYPWMDVIVVTQKDDVRLAVRSMRMGVFEYLVKPVDKDELFLTMDRLLERRRLLEQQNRLIDESMQYLQAQTIYRRCLEILSTLDFENLCEMIMRHTLQATGAQGGILWLNAPEERTENGDMERMVLSAYRGLVALNEFPTSLSMSASHLEEWSTGEPHAPFFGYPAEVLGLERERSGREALFVPLMVDDLPVGLLVLLDKLREDFTDRDLNITRTMAEFSAIALKNSRRFQALERVGLKDQNTAAYNMTYFIDYAGKEIYKARRYGRAFSLVTVIIDRYKFLQDHFKPKVCTQIARKLVQSISRVARDSDILARVSDHEYYLLLPETDALGARMFVRRSRDAFLGDSFIKKIGQDYPISISFGSASFPLDGEDFDQLLGICRSRTELSRTSLQRRLELSDLPFWDCVELLVGEDVDYDAEPEKRGIAFRMAEDAEGASAHGMFTTSLVQGIEYEVSLQATSDPGGRAIIYRVGGVLDGEILPAERAADRSERVKVFLVGLKGEQDAAVDHPSLTRVFLEDERLAKHCLFLVLGERLAYGFLGRQRGKNQWAGFHTHDEVLVESLIAKLQDQYNFQRQY